MTRNADIEAQLTDVATTVDDLRTTCIGIETNIINANKEIINVNIFRQLSKYFKCSSFSENFGKHREIIKRWESLCQTKLGRNK